MPRPRDTAISATARRAAKYRFHGTVTRTTSQARATPPAPMVSSVDTGTPARRPSQVNSSAAAAPARIVAHHLIMLRCGSVLMPPSWAAHRDDGSAKVLNWVSSALTAGGAAV